MKMQDRGWAPWPRDWVEVFGGDRGHQAKLCKARWFPPIFFFSLGLSPPISNQAHHVTNRMGLSVSARHRPGNRRLALQPGAIATETETPIGLAVTGQSEQTEHSIRHY